MQLAIQRENTWKRANTEREAIGKHATQFVPRQQQQKYRNDNILTATPIGSLTAAARTGRGFENLGQLETYDFKRIDQARLKGLSNKMRRNDGR